MSTVAKGNQFEDRVFDAIKHELASERLGLLPKACQIFKKKKYYSKIRKADIEIDVSIEVFLPNMASWSLLWAIECKDYKGALPVNDVEEFHAKIEQIAGDNVKATLVLSGVLQKSALEYCRSLGIGVVRLLSNDRLVSYVAEEHGVYYKGKYYTKYSSAYPYDLIEAKIKAERVVSALTELKFTSNNQSFFALQNDRIYQDWKSLVDATILSNKDCLS